MQYDEIFKRKIITMFLMEASLDSEVARFTEFVNYFKEKQRIGVINIESFNDTPIQVILVPKCELRDKIVQFSNNFLVIVSEQTANYPNYEEMMNVNTNNTYISGNNPQINADQQMLS